MLVEKCVAESESRFDLWAEFVKTAKVQSMLEIGVFRGDYALRILKECVSLERYYMIDPWRQLADWNKPANKDNDTFERYLSETKTKTDFAADKRIILRGKTAEVIDEIPDRSLDFVYIDGDHTLRGVIIDLVNSYPKVRRGGWIGGDDFCRTIWQHSMDFEPTLVFPTAVYFAEAVGARIYALPFSQFLIEKVANKPFTFVDLTGHYRNITLREQFSMYNALKVKIKEVFPIVGGFVKEVKGLMAK